MPIGDRVQKVRLGGASVLLAAVLTVASLAPGSGASAATLKTLYSFCSRGGTYCTDGSGPEAGLIMDAAGHLYGTTYMGGDHGNYGTVFELTPNAAKTEWTETVLHSFCALSGCTDGHYPKAGVIMDKSGKLYGTTDGEGGVHAGGTAFEVTPNAAKTKWTDTVLYGFCALAYCADGAVPSGVIMDAAGHLYGTTGAGGAYGGTDSGGTVFELTPNAANTKWTHKILYSFCARSYCADGEGPGAIMDKSGHIYGTTSGGGVHDGGTVFDLALDAAKSKETVLYSFCTVNPCTDGSYPLAGVIMDKSGHLYGTTSGGGAHGDNYTGGTVFELTPNAANTKWTHKILYSFCTMSGCTDGSVPSGLIMDKSGNLYGTTLDGGTVGDGTVFELTPNAASTKWTHKILYNFGTQSGDGASPFGGLIRDDAGHLYGTTSYGGGANDGGTVFELTP